MNTADLREIGVGMLGYAFMVKAHSNAYCNPFVHKIHHLLRAIADDGDVAPFGATFEDGYRAAEVCDAIARSSETGLREDVVYR